MRRRRTSNTVRNQHAQRRVNPLRLGGHLAIEIGNITHAPPVQPISAIDIWEVDRHNDEEADNIEEEDPLSKEDIPEVEVNYDDTGRVIIKPLGIGWTPSRHAAKALSDAIRSHFEGPYHHYEAVPEDVQLKWWTEFKTRVTWDAKDEWKSKKVYETKVKKRLSDLLTKARDTRRRPHWIGEQAWVDLLIYWVSDKKFKDMSAQNKINRGSSRGAVHTTGRKSHVDIAVGLERKYGKPVDPDVLFLATHRNKDGCWVDDRARDTYEKYHELLRVAQSQNAEGSTDDIGAIKLQCWKDAAGGKTRGRCYGTGDLASNIRGGVSCLTQETLLAPHTSHAHQQSAETEALRQQVQEATERADAATMDLVEANQRYALLEEQMRLMQEQLKMVLDCRSRGSLMGTTQMHPPNAEDLDEERPPSRQRRRPPS